MATGSLINDQGRLVMLYRNYTGNTSLSSTQYTAITQFKIGINGVTPSISNTDLNESVPISDGTTNDDGSNIMTGSSGGDNTTNNTTTYKEGAGNTDVTAQNLIANNTNATKIWTIADLSSAGTNTSGTQPFALWFYILDAAALAKFKTSGTALEVKLGSDSSNYYSKTCTVSDLAVGWNWITSSTTNVNALTEVGTVAGNIDTFIIEITTNNATDEFIAGDVIYDLLRQWATSDLFKDISTGFPSLDLVNMEATIRKYITTLQGNGFLIDSVGTFNEDTTPIMLDENNTGGDSKSSTDEFAFVAVDRVI